MAENKLVLRIDETIYEEMKKAAKEDDRSLNSWILQAIKEKLSK